MSSRYEDWIKKVEEALASINMSMDDWQSGWPFDFRAEYESGKDADDAAMKANRFWWLEQNKALRRDCRSTPNCWLPRGATKELASPQILIYGRSLESQLINEAIL